MNILVCIKEVPTVDMQLCVDSSGRWIEPGNQADYVMNRFDEFALEEAVRIKAHFPGATVEVLSVGPERCRAVIRRALAKGADTGVHLHDPSPGYAAAATVSTAIAAFCRARAFDLILTGVISEDLMQGITGPLLAARLEMPCAAAVIRQRIDPVAGSVQATCEMEGGWTSDVRLALPALLTIQSGINRPRYPSLSNMLRARRQALPSLPVASRDADENMPRVIALAEPVVNTNTVFFEGRLVEKAGALLKLLDDRGVLKR